MRNSFVKNIVFFICLTFSSSAIAERLRIIYDPEIQEVVEEISHPLLNITKLEKIQIYILDNKTPNAFTAGGGMIFVHSGLIALFPDPNILRGVLAHELGHIAAHHVVATREIVDNKKALYIGSTILGLCGAALSNRAEPLIQGMLIGEDLARKEILRYSRENEDIADLKAQDYLERAGYNYDGLVKLLAYLNTYSNPEYQSRYDLTHPLSHERIASLKSRKASKSFVESASLKFRYEMISAKLSAYLGMQLRAAEYSKDAKTYYDAIIAMNSSNKNLAENKINQLIADYPTANIFLKTKAEIYANFGDIRCIAIYKRLVDNSNNQILKAEYASSMIKLSDRKEEIAKAISILETLSSDIKNSYTVLDLLSIAYGKISKQEYSLYYKALMSLMIGDIKKAKQLAKLVKTKSANNLSLTLKCDDIMQLEE